MLYGLWFGRLLLASLPQAVLWSCFLALALFLAGTSLFRPGRLRLRFRAEGTRQQGRLESWVRLLRQAAQEDYYKWRLAQRIRELALETLAQGEQISPKQVRQRLLAGQLALPPEIEAYLQASLKPLSQFAAPRFFFRTRAPASPLQLEPERIIQFLEDYHHDGT